MALLCCWDGGRKIVFVVGDDASRLAFVSVIFELQRKNSLLFL